MLSPRLAKGADYSRQAWDDGAMVLRRSNAMRSESIDHTTSAVPEKGGSRRHKKDSEPGRRLPEASSGGEAAAPKKSHLPGPGLAVFDRAADPERVEVMAVFYSSVLLFVCSFRPSITSFHVYLFVCLY